LAGTTGTCAIAAWFSRREDLRMLSTYNDNRRDLAGDMAKLISEE
jgi:hypothetical protein